jgi:hypothetical protein
MNRRAKSPIIYQVIVNLISNIMTKTELSVRCELDTTSYAKGITVSDSEMGAINLIRDKFHGEWNYAIRPRHLYCRSHITLPTQAISFQAVHAATTAS